MDDAVGNMRRTSDHRSTRRTFSKLAASAGVGLLSGPFGGQLEADENKSWFEATIPQLQVLMSSGKLSSRELTQAYLRRIQDLNPLLQAVIETNPQAVATAAQLDAERRAGSVRGPLHGIPVLLKDNIATADSMQTTAGSVLLMNSKVPADAPLVARLRRAGAVILGKANLSEWANFRGFAPFNGWSARGGFTRNPYVLDYDPVGSSSGSAVAAAANLCAAAVGTETSGSILAPSGNNHVVGLKPTVGLVSQSGIIPISSTQDTAGPMTRTVTDAAIMLGVMQSPFGPVTPNAVPADYTAGLRRGALLGARIGVDVRYFTPDYGGEPDIASVVYTAIDVMKSLGATVVETDTGDAYSWIDALLPILLYEFKIEIGKYLSGLRHTPATTLADLIALNRARCPQEMRYFGQELFEWAQDPPPFLGDLSEAGYQAARNFVWAATRANGIDRVRQQQQLDAIIAPSFSFASAVPAAAGYPSISIPIDVRPDGKPAGMWMYSGFLQEPKLLALAYDLEQALGPRRTPKFLGAVPSNPPDAGICALLPKNSPGQGAGIGMRRDLATGKPMRKR